MNSLYHKLASQSVWFPDKHPSIRTIPQQWQKWLLDKGSLTERLIEFCASGFHVRVLSERWQKPLPHEARRLNSSGHQLARVREVELYCGETPVVYARSVIPLQLYLRQRHTLQNVGTRPLGQLLFKDGRIRVSQRGIAIYTADEINFYGRCTPYQYFGGQILVSEFFIDDDLVI